MPMDMLAITAIPDAVWAELRRVLEPIKTLGDLLDWSRQLEPPLPAPEVVTQDEYTHDVLIPYAGGRWLDFDSS